MKRLKQQILAGVLAFVMCISTVNVTAFAQENETTSEIQKIIAISEAGSENEASTENIEITDTSVSGNNVEPVEDKPRNKKHKKVANEKVYEGVISWLQMDMADGDSSLDDLVDASIPIYKRGQTGEQALAISHPGKPQKYFQTLVNGVKGGRYIDQYSNGVAYEAKVGYTCLSQRIKTQILKDAYLMKNGDVTAVVWEFFRSDITGRVGASKELLNFLTENGIHYIIHQ